MVGERILMKRYNLLLLLSLLLTLVVFTLDIFIAGMVLICGLVLYMSLRIMEETTDVPDVVAKLRPDAKGIIVRNRGNAPAFRIHVALVPMNIEFDIPSLEVESSFEYSLNEMLSEAKAAISFENRGGRRMERQYTLSALGKDEEDLLKPAFPIFGWK